jgi:hypothetical protein
MAMALGRTIIALSLIAGGASAETSPRGEGLPAPVRPLQLELVAPRGVELKIRPETGNSEDAPDFVICPPSCRLSVYPGRYRIDAAPPPDSDLRRVRRTLDVLTDARIDVAPGSRGEHGWGLGLTIGGGVVFGLGTVFYALTHFAGDDPDVLTNVATLSMMGVGAPMTAGGIYLLVHGRNRVTVEGTWQRSMVPVPPPESHVDIGWRF